MGERLVGSRGFTGRRPQPRVMIERRGLAAELTNRAAALSRSGSLPATAADGLEAVIHEEINRLPARYRVAVVLCDLEGRTHEQAARHMGCAVGTVKSRLARGRERLRVRLIGAESHRERCASRHSGRGRAAGRSLSCPMRCGDNLRYRDR